MTNVHITNHADLADVSVPSLTITDTRTQQALIFNRDAKDGVWGDGLRLDHDMSIARLKAIFSGLDPELRPKDGLDLGQFYDPTTGKTTVPEQADVVQPVFHYNDVEEAAALALDAIQQNRI
ncbi:hypothetical protein [Methylorubrum thiocyanatum]|uniref:hypothetical protein n=1 Tax=Methylorubrum thiocyanatum TaxID=47958 RepID=UPI00365D27AA